MGEPAAARRASFLRRAAVGVGLGLTTAAFVVYAQSKGDPARGAAHVATCEACHGPAGGAPLVGMPALAGQQQEFLELQLILMREGLRDVAPMTGLLRKFSDRDLIDIATYYSVQTAAPARGGRDAKRFATGESLAEAMGCGSCHMGGFTGQRQVPRITHQREDYLVTALTAYRDNVRSGVDTSMNAVMYKSSDADIAALAHYLAHN